MVGFSWAKAQAIEGTQLKVKQADVEDSLSLFNGNFPFKNVNLIPFYYAKKAFREIERYEKQKNWEGLYPVLSDYVKNFGIENFYKDTDLLWRLAKTAEILGKKEEAKALYRLVLKHHRDSFSLQWLQKHYDSLNRDQADLYVPLKYYYELVEYRQEIDTLRPPKGILLNMGDSINSSSADYGPSLSLKDETLLFTSKRQRARRGLEVESVEGIYLSKKERGKWRAAKPFENINSQFNEGSPCLSKDGKTLYFSRCWAPDGIGNCDIYVSHLQSDGIWSSPENLGSSVNSSSWDSHPSLSHTEDTLYFASDRLGGFGLSDIYFTYKSSDGNWVKAQNAGPVINTRGSENSPFYHPVHHVLYFSSDYQTLNFGQFDIYKSNRRQGHWENPKNIGPLINGKGSEFYFTIDSESKDIYYARSETESLEDMSLYSFPLPMEAQPLAVTRLSGSLTDSLTHKPYQGIVSIIDLDHGIEVAPKFLRADGSFEFDLINNNNYLLIIQGDNFFRIEEMFYLNGEMEMGRYAKPLSTNIKFESLEFDHGKAEIKTEMRSDLNKIVNFLLDNPEFKLVISGHTDSAGDDDFNLTLSQKRADAIKEYVTYFNPVAEFRVNAIGYGSSKPIVEEKTAVDRKLNRRVEFHIYRPSIEEMEEDEKIEQEEEW
ncbi:OmpA family protein [Cytophagales bacterium RKSG123]|nr:OmpA family protein [Xanthovirga aplysinae]